MERCISVDHADFSFMKYKISVDKYSKKDARELNFQNSYK